MTKLKKVKTEKLIISESDWQRLFDVAFDVSKSNNRKKIMKPYEAFRLCLSIAEQAIKTRGVILCDSNQRAEELSDKLKSVITNDEVVH